MTDNESVAEAVELLQQLGLKEYEAACFVGLSRLSTGTAKDLSEITSVPRTRVYDAVRVLEARGLVQVQHSTPQRFKAVPIEEAVRTLEREQADRFEQLRRALDGVEPVEARDDEPVQEVWTLSGRTPIANRCNELIAAADSEVVLVLGDASLLTDDLVAALSTLDGAVDLFVGTITRAVRDAVEDRVPEATVFVSELDWLAGADEPDPTAIGRLLLTDRSNILVSTLPTATGDEHAVFGTGFGNGLVVVTRRLMAQGLLATNDAAD
ncbi:TrmB family transcriptional regulator [Halobaculum lipolyticum]|uniref:TrmB family transcriptional regulator n=1 Tax=Halobaculum lipolyticum TaxID=3032001 RepID=A0ABD5WH20_9EURY|nr:helix-turn-helix domain-containing protein [Halobaculum sp. DT31]